MPDPPGLHVPIMCCDQLLDDAVHQLYTKNRVLPSVCFAGSTCLTLLQAYEYLLCAMSSCWMTLSINCTVRVSAGLSWMKTVLQGFATPVVLLETPR